MKPSQIGKAYDKLADLWDRNKFNNENGIDQHKRAIAFTDKRGAALDVGCGWNGRIIDLLLKEGFSPEGIDISSEMIKRSKEIYPEVIFYNEDICSWEPSRNYDFITAWDSIWHVPLENHGDVLKKLFSALNQGGICIFSAGGLDEASEITDDFMGPKVYYSALGIPKLLDLISTSGGICRHLEYDQYPEIHIYLIVQKA